MKRESKSKNEDVFDVGRKRKKPTTEDSLEPKDYSFIFDIIELVFEVILGIFT